MSMCRVISCVVGKAWLLWPACSLDKTLLAFALLHFVLQGQICLLLWTSLDFLFLYFNPLWWKGHLFWLLVLEDLVGLHGSIEIQLIQHYQSGHSLGLHRKSIKLLCSKELSWKKNRERKEGKRKKRTTRGDQASVSEAHNFIFKRNFYTLTCT